MKKNITIILVALITLVGSAYSSDDQLKSTALKAVNLLFLNGNTSAFLTLVSPDAERKTNGAGSAIEAFKKEGTFTRVSLSKLVFVTLENISEIKEAYPGDMWDEDRVPAHLGDGLGCLVIVDVGEKKKGMMFFGLKIIEGQSRITYFDDN